MSIFVGANEVQRILVGSTEVQEVYVGGTLVWSNVPNINFYLNPGWENSTGWVYTSSSAAGTAKVPFRNPSTVRLYTDVLGTFPSWTVYTNKMEYANIPIAKSGSYRLTLITSGSNRMNDAAKWEVRLSGAATGNFTQVFDDTGVGTQTFDFTCTDNASITVEIYTVNNFVVNTEAYIDVQQVFLTKV